MNTARAHAGTRIALALCLLFLGAAGVPAAGSRAAPAAAPATPLASGSKEPPAAAFLRIESGRHSASINRLAGARGGSLLASVSDDKTARLWDAATGELLSVLRVPLAEGLEGALYSVALSPDGTRLLAAGYTGIAWDGRPSVYVFDVEAERMIGRLGPLPAIVNHMAYSPDGKRFALSLGKAGVSLHEATGKPVSQDRDFKDQATWVAFAPDGRWVATGLDGLVRLYDPDGKLIVRHKFAGAGQPFSVEFAPSGEIVAVGFLDRPRVEILSLPDLEPRLAPSVGEFKQGGFSTVAFVPAGASTHLVASGSVRGADGRIVMRRWADAGLGRPVDEAIADDTVTQILPLESGRLALATAEPALRIGPLLGERRVLAGNNLDLRNVVRGRLATDRQGTRVLIQLDKDQPPILLDLANRRVGAADAKAAAGEWIGWRSAAGGTAVTEWRLSRQTKIAGKPIGFDPDERALSVAVASDGQVVLGTDFRLQLFDKAGVQRHAIDVPGAAWGVVVSGDGKRAIAALGDGSVRFYDIAGGKLVERLSFFLHRDLARWVSWLPEGFFDHSDEGGRELVGYVLNRKRAETPEWVSFAQVYRLFYAPDLVKDRLSGRSGADAAIAARLSEIGDVRKRFDAVTPPSAELEAVCFERLGSDACTPVDAGQRLTRAAGSADTPVSAATPAPAADTARAPAVPAAADFQFKATPQLRFDYALPAGIEQVLLRYRVTDRGGGTGAVDFFLNDRNAGRQRGRGAATPIAKGEAAQMERRLALGPGINRIQVRAYDQANGVYGESRPFLIKTALPTDADKPSLYVVAAGVNAYKGNGLPPLQLARADAEGFIETVRAGAAPLFKTVQVAALYDEAVTPQALSDALAKVARDAHERDTVLIYLAGHGAMDQGSYFYVTQNVDLLSDGKRTGLAKANSVEEIYARAMPQSFTGAVLVEALGAIRARNGFIFLDTCHSGGVNLDAGASNIGHETGRYILTAAANVEEALDRYDDTHGVFAAAVLKALQGVGGTAGTDGVVDNFRLGHFVRANVEILAKEVAPQHQQSARFKISSQDATPFPIVRAKVP
ncbi:MAG: caspase family protein [Proteobacteria bacterium]|nr:caspase family protein [Pseudomonadota bacterium]MBI3497338.1 caspase family protein [Pseudomonadota bacterium]